MIEGIGPERRTAEETREIIDRVAEQAAKKAVRTTFSSLGLDTSDPIKIQKNMAFLDESRERCEKFYGEMWNNMTTTLWRVVKIIFVLGILAGLAKLGFSIESLKPLFVGAL